MRKIKIAVIIVAVIILAFVIVFFAKDIILPQENVQNEPNIKVEAETTQNSEEEKEIYDKYINALAASQTAENKEKVVAYVDGVPVYRSEILDEKASNDFAIDQNLINLPEQERKSYAEKYFKTEAEILEEVIERKVIIAIYKKENSVDEKSIIESNKAFIDEQISGMKKVRYDFFERYLRARNLTEEEYITLFSQNVVDRYCYNAYFQKINVSDAEDKEKAEEDLVKNGNCEVIIIE